MEIRPAIILGNNYTINIEGKSSHNLNLSFNGNVYIINESFTLSYDYTPIKRGVIFINDLSNEFDIKININNNILHINNNTETHSNDFYYVSRMTLSKQIKNIIKPQTIHNHKQIPPKNKVNITEKKNIIVKLTMNDIENNYINIKLNNTEQIPIIKKNNINNKVDAATANINIIIPAKSVHAQYDDIPIIKKHHAHNLLQPVIMPPPIMPSQQIITPPINTNTLVNINVDTTNKNILLYEDKLITQLPADYLQKIKASYKKLYYNNTCDEPIIVKRIFDNEVPELSLQEKMKKDQIEKISSFSIKYKEKNESRSILPKNIILKEQLIINKPVIPCLIIPKYTNNQLHKLKLYNNIISEFKCGLVQQTKYTEKTNNSVKQLQLLALLKNDDYDYKIITDIYISSALKKFANKISREYGFNTNINNKTYDKIVVFGCYNINDLNFIKKHANKEITLIWGGSDCNNLQGNIEFMSYLLKAKNIRHVAISDTIKDKLHDYNLNCFLKVHFRLLNYFDYKNIADIHKCTNSVYIYTSLDKIRAKEIYGSNIYMEVIAKMPHINFIIAYGQYTQEEIIAVYHKCFLGLRLTVFDGNANTVQELGMLGINCVHNGEFPNSLSWSNVAEVCNWITEEMTICEDKRKQIRENMINYLEPNNTSNYDWMIY